MSPKICRYTWLNLAHAQGCYFPLPPPRTNSAMFGNWFVQHSSRALLPLLPRANFLVFTFTSATRRSPYRLYSNEPRICSASRSQRITTAQRPSITLGAILRSSLSESPVFTTPFGSSNITPTSSPAFGHCKSCSQSFSSQNQVKRIMR